MTRDTCPIIVRTCALWASPSKSGLPSGEPFGVPAFAGMTDEI